MIKFVLLCSLAVLVLAEEDPASVGLKAVNDGAGTASRVIEEGAQGIKDAAAGAGSFAANTLYKPLAGAFSAIGGIFNPSKSQ